MENIYCWIRSSEIRTFLRENYPLSVLEKATIVCSACRSIKDKYAVLGELLKEAREEEDKDVLEQLIRLYQWILGQLRENRQGQIFICGERTIPNGIRDLETRDYVDELFCSCEEAFNYLRDAEQNWKLVEGEGFFLEQYAPVNGKMDEVIGYEFYFIDGSLQLVMFEPRLHRGFNIYDELNIEFMAKSIHNWKVTYNEFPLPFLSGDLVRLDPPVLGEPTYGVLYIFEMPHDRLRWLFYLQDGALNECSMRYQSIGCSSWRVIDWMHPAKPSELPPGQETLLELSEAFRQAGQNTDEGEMLFSRLFDLLPAPIWRRTLLKLLEVLDRKF